MANPRSTRFLVAAFLGLALLVPRMAGAQERAPEAPAAYFDSGLDLGTLPPDFTLQSIDGDAFRLSAARGDRPILLLFFRGTW